ncbi:hypothetical protein GJ496_005323 [Pomphorhynchus laevis]|nr:hypothetical protein GJ496_005323 [Pomphorhynchus laevis]
MESNPCEDETSTTTNSTPTLKSCRSKFTSPMPVNQTFMKNLTDEVDALLMQCNELEQETSSIENKDELIEEYMQALHEYNEVKDIAVSVFGRMANIEGVPVKDIYKRYEIQMDD